MFRRSSLPACWPRGGPLGPPPRGARAPQVLLCIGRQAPVVSVPAAWRAAGPSARRACSAGFRTLVSICIQPRGEPPGPGRRLVPRAEGPGGAKALRAPTFGSPGAASFPMRCDSTGDVDIGSVSAGRLGPWRDCVRSRAEQGGVFTSAVVVMSSLRATLNRVGQCDLGPFDGALCTLCGRLASPVALACPETPPSSPGSRSRSPRRAGAGPAWAGELSPTVLVTPRDLAASQASRGCG